ncbi:hypothetical protein G7Y31_11510 [Corynebacterium lizhenjunii]|uniref:Uncharacterized protein n=1 Tax=Corynebacterium lizhenjunii TaxID=2709394 RepID=A0A7T0PBX3_9CORY|nr:hypothetical protein [Corynebacterium lizhenjunii]QPK79097.1 hypothetical protein G7Y31_11510 [Corynebacterium lizhenjunii]
MTSAMKNTGGVRTVSLKLLGGTRNMEFDCLAKAEEVVRELSGAGNEPVDWTFRRKAAGGAQIELEVSADVAAAWDEGLTALQEGGELPELWTPAAIKALIELGELGAAQGDTTVELSIAERRVALNEELVEAAKKCAVVEHLSYGGVSGRLYQYSNRDGDATALLEDEETGAAVTLYIPPELEEQVKAKLESEVEIWGLKRYWRDSYDLVDVEVAKIWDVVPPPVERIPAEDFRGILGSDWLEGLTPVELVRRERDA